MTTTATPPTDTAASDKIRSEKSNTRRAMIGSYIVLLFFSILYIGPLLMLINTSLKTLPEFFQDPIGLASSLNFDNFVEAWDLANFPQYMANSALYTFTATAIFIATSLFSSDCTSGCDSLMENQRDSIAGRSPRKSMNALSRCSSNSARYAPGSETVQRS